MPRANVATQKQQSKKSAKRSNGAARRAAKVKREYEATARAAVAKEEAKKAGNGAPTVPLTPAVVTRIVREYHTVARQQTAKEEAKRAASGAQQDLPPTGFGYLSKLSAGERRALAESLFYARGDLDRHDNSIDTRETSVALAALASLRDDCELLEIATDEQDAYVLNDLAHRFAWRNGNRAELAIELALLEAGSEA